MRHRGIRSLILAGFLLVFGVPEVVFGGDVAFQQTNLDTSATDPDLINPWGISSSSSSPFWVSDNGTGKSTLYNGAGTKLGLVVTMPNNDPITGQVFNSTANFGGNHFLFASENGTIDGWKSGTSATQLFAVTDAVYKGLAISAAGDVLYAANFHNGTVDLFDSSHTAPIGSFTDPNLPAGYAPFNIAILGGKIYVTFALQDSDAHDDVGGVGHGLIDVFDPTTHTLSRLVSGSAAGGTVDALNSPWGLALAPSTFGQYAGDLLVGNFGDGTINAFDASSGAFLGTLRDSLGNPLVNPGLWGLIVGNGGQGGSPDSLYIAAGGADEGRGVFARISAVPEPGTGVLGLIGLCSLGAGWGWRRRRRAVGA